MNGVIKLPVNSPRINGKIIFVDEVLTKSKNSLANSNGTMDYDDDDDDDELWAPSSSYSEIEKLLNGGSNFKKIGVESIVKKITHSKCCSLTRRQQRHLVDYITNKNYVDDELCGSLITDLLSAHKLTNSVCLRLIDRIISLPGTESILNLFLDVMTDLPERCAFKIIKYCLKSKLRINDHVDHLDDHYRAILLRLLCLEFCAVQMTDELKLLSVDEATHLLNILNLYLTKLMTNGDTRPDKRHPSQLQVSRFVALLLDASSSRAFATSEEFREQVLLLECIVTSTLTISDTFQKWEEQKVRTEKEMMRVRNEYTVESLLL